MEGQTLTEVMPIEADADGVMRVSNTRVTLDTVVAAFKEGATPEEIAQQYPSLPLADVYAVVSYYLRRSSDVEVYLARRREQAERTRREHESRHDPIGMRDRLMARRSKRMS